MIIFKQRIDNGKRYMIFFPIIRETIPY
ncbi:hypothetical protein CBM2615_B60004 [Cupriavidus taiwanensis]|uniref:Uncharacterized protein n=1 Tax=Cupriavidus taiwanensis TaxID=164546 RepID=A0A976B305_9BURK|nr:hypothetical protein CBM2614_B50004 [Cupriavidus taiwanensis]SOZ69641.1 hypothetical protein CBM2615_B60004 [Cupriavidus taiwanensis]SOZ72856.1 hypothetical protein CBM2613_B50004 [Cupriavidus taiwanensis]SPA09715.1 hypothetical protein CBM2625_B50004 [Cupriavidus taiwanensis]